MNFWVRLGIILGLAYLIFKITALWVIMKAHRKKGTSGIERLIGVIAVAKTDINPKGIVYYMGEDWSAETHIHGEVIKAGERVKVIGVEGLRLKVKKVD